MCTLALIELRFQTTNIYLDKRRPTLKSFSGFSSAARRRISLTTSSAAGRLVPELAKLAQVSSAC